MPYINYLETDDNYNYYKPSESLQNLFENVVITPLRGSLPGVASNPNVIYDLSKTVLDQGRTNFDESYQDYTPQNKVLLYCVYYMPMHLYSSYHFYRHIPLIGINNVVFIDFGCGPLTSGVAFWAAAGERNITYIGIDRAQSMLTKACEINGYHPEFEGPFYPDVGFYLINDLQLPIASINGYKYYQLLQMLHNILMLNLWNSDDTLIIFNFCYFLQSKSIDHSNLESLARLVQDVVDRYGSYKIFIAYQDPERDRFQQRWYNFRSRLISNSSFRNQFTWQDNTSPMYVKYDRLMLGGQHSTKVSYDMLYN